MTPDSAQGPAHDHSSCLHVKEEAAIALLQRSEPAPEVLAHLELCPPCKDEYLELAALPPLLGRTGRALAAAPADPPSSGLLDRLLGEVARQRRRRRITLGALATATAAACAAAVVVSTLPDGATPPARPRTTTAPGAQVLASGTGRDDVSGAAARIAVRADHGGSLVSVTVHGWPTEKPCRMIVHDSDGGVRAVGIFTIDTTADDTYVEGVDLPPSAISRVELVDDRSGRAMIDVPVRRA